MCLRIYNDERVRFIRKLNSFQVCNRVEYFLNNGSCNFRLCLCRSRLEIEVGCNREHQIAMDKRNASYKMVSLFEEMVSN